LNIYKVILINYTMAKLEHHLSLKLVLLTNTDTDNSIIYRGHHMSHMGLLSQIYHIMDYNAGIMNKFIKN